MEEKFNQATPQRPAGTRLLDAEIVPVDLAKYIQEIKNEKAYELNGKNAITVFKSEKVTITLLALKKNEFFQSLTNEEHSLLSLHVITGEIDFTVSEELIHLSENQLLNYHLNLPFTARALADTICKLTVTK
jgi:hypothetical protein